jgi:Na+/H+-dicarboxylate symporter
MLSLKKQTRSLTFKIVVGMILGFLFGVILNLIGPDEVMRTYLIDGALYGAGQIFIASLMVLVVPLVFVSLVCGTAALDDITKLGRIGGKTLGLYLVTTAIAVTVAIGFGVTVRPGDGFQLQTAVEFEAPEAPPFVETIVNLFPRNPIAAMAEGNMLQIIVFALLFGLALTYAGQAGKRVLAGFQDLNEVIMKLVLLLMQLAPYGVFALLARVFADQGFEAIAPLAWYFFTVLFVLIFHAMVIYPSFLKLLSGLSPVTFWRRFKEVPVFAFSTASSNATLPVTLEVVEEKLGVDNSIASFTVPLGATINMDGTAIMQGVATAFIAQAYGVDIGVAGYVMVVVTATLASIGTAGVPGVGLIMLAMVLSQVGLPVEGIGLILGVDRLLDMVRTAVNVTGDATVSCIVAKSENQFDEKKFNSSQPLSLEPSEKM